MGQEVFIRLVDEAWLMEVIAAWKARDRGLPEPPVRWPECDGMVRVYLSDDPLDWPQVFLEWVPDKPLPGGSSWYWELAALVEAVGQISQRRDSPASSEALRVAKAFLEFGAAFLPVGGWRNDYVEGARCGILLSPVTCAAMLKTHSQISLATLEPLLAQTCQENQATDPAQELRWYFAGRGMRELVSDFLDYSARCCEQSVQTRRAVSVYVG